MTGWRGVWAVGGATCQLFCLSRRVVVSPSRNFQWEVWVLEDDSCGSCETAKEVAGLAQGQ